MGDAGMGVIDDEQLGILLRVYKGEFVFNAGVFDDNGCTLATEEKIAEHKAVGECLSDLSARGLVRILFTSSTGFINVERITPAGRDCLARALAIGSALIAPEGLAMIQPAARPSARGFISPRR